MNRIIPEDIGANPDKVYISQARSRDGRAYKFLVPQDQVKYDTDIVYVRHDLTQPKPMEQSDIHRLKQVINIIHARRHYPGGIDIAALCCEALEILEKKGI